MHHALQSLQPPAEPVILIGGSVRAAAVDAGIAGYRIVAIDRFGDRDLRAVCDSWHRWEPQQDCAALLDRWPAAAVVPSGGFTWCQRTDFAAGRLVAFPSRDMFAALCDPQQLRGVAECCGIDFPATLSAEELAADGDGDGDGQRSALRSGRWLIKPRLGTGGLGIRRWHSGSAEHSESGQHSESDQAESDQGGSGQPAVALQRHEDLQQWVGGRPVGVSYFARERLGRRDVRLLGACESLTHRHHRDWPWLYGGSLGPCRLSADCHALLMRIGERIAARFELVGLFNVDLIRRWDGSLVLLEINPRYSASMELLRGQRTVDPPQPPASNPPPPPASSSALSPAGAAVSLIDWHLAAYQEAAGQITTELADQRCGWRGEPLPHDGDATPALACKRIVYAAEAMRIDGSTEQLAQMVSGLAAGEVSFHDLPANGETVPAGGPALTVIVRGGDAQQLLRCSHRIAAHLRRGLRIG